MSLSMQSNIQQLVIAENFLSEYSKWQTLRTITEQLSNICTTNKYLQSAHVYYRDMKRVYHTANLSGKGSFDDFTLEQYSLLLKMAIHPETMHLYTNPITGVETLSIFIAPFAQINPRFLIEMVLSQKYIKEITQAEDLVGKDLYCIQMCNEIVGTNISNNQLDVLEKVKPLAMNDLPLEIKINKHAYKIMKFELPYCDGYYLRLISTDGFMKPLQMSSLYLKLFFAVLIISCVLFFIGIYLLVHKPLTKLTKAFEILENGRFNIRIIETRTSDFTYLYNAFNDMTVKLEELIDSTYQQKILLQKAELKQLQAQINPHFLYNSFFLLQSMLKTDLIEESQLMAEQLGLYFKYITKNSMEYITLENEYNHAKIYANLQSLRFSKRIKINIEEIPNECKNILCPKLILQPILENAFNYGLSNKLSGGVLSMRFEKHNNLVHIIVEDNGEELTDKKLYRLKTELNEASTGPDAREMSGMLNIHRRLTIYSKAKGGITVDRSPYGGLKVDIVLNTEVTQ